uniref:Uncharacterized protein n=1 Tax=Cacopsylla melanoneura TaxID=428564 RepID=A0A8D8Z2E5_9HEMI
MSFSKTMKYIIPDKLYQYHITTFTLISISSMEYLHRFLLSIITFIRWNTSTLLHKLAYSVVVFSPSGPNVVKQYIFFKGKLKLKTFALDPQIMMFGKCAHILYFLNKLVFHHFKMNDFADVFLQLNCIRFLFDIFL